MLRRIRESSTLLLLTLLPLYGENVSVRCIDAVEEVLKKGEMFRTEEERLCM